MTTRPPLLSYEDTTLSGTVIAEGQKGRHHRFVIGGLAGCACNGMNAPPPFSPTSAHLPPCILSAPPLSGFGSLVGIRLQVGLSHCTSYSVQFAFHNGNPQKPPCTKKAPKASLCFSLSLSLCRCVLVDVSLNVLLALHCSVGLCWAGFPGAQLHGMCSSVMHILAPHVLEIPHPFIPHLRYNDVRNPLPLPWPHDDNQAPSTE